MIDNNKYKLDAINFDQDDWELINAIRSVQEKHRFKPINILEIGSGNACLVYSLSIEMIKWVQKLISIDVINESSPPDKLFYEKRTAFSTIYNHDKEKVDAMEANANDANVIKSIKDFFLEDEVSVFIIEYLKDDKYMNEIISNYEDILDERTIIIYKYLNKSSKSIKYFNKLSKKYTKIKRLENGVGIGVIYEWK